MYPVNARSRSAITVDRSVASEAAVPEIMRGLQSMDLQYICTQTASVMADTRYVQIITAGAQIMSNFRVWDAYCTGSGNLDVWVTFTAKVGATGESIIQVGAYLTDIVSLHDRPTGEALRHFWYERYDRRR